MPQYPKNFILGLGHQKCGTTWVYRYLSKSHNFAKGFTKEAHVWDALDIPILNLVDKEIPSTDLDPIGYKRYIMRNNTDLYFDYYSSLYHSEFSLAADISPSYSGLKENRLRSIKEAFALRKVNVKALILIRDPLSRIKSAVRYNLDKRNYSQGIHMGELDFNNALEQYYKTEHCQIRTCYQITIKEAQKVFDKDDLFVGIYENMFSELEIAKLSTFLGSDFNPKFGRIKINQGTGTIVKSSIDQQIKDFYKDVYDYCFLNHPITLKLWDN